MDNETKLQLNIEINISHISEIKEIVNIVAEIQKEHSCNCTLSVKRI